MVPEGAATLDGCTMLEEYAVADVDAIPAGDTIPEEGALPEEGATPEDGAMIEDGLRVKLAEGFVRKPVDPPLPVTWVPLFRAYGALDETSAEETGGPTTAEDSDGPATRAEVVVLHMSAIRGLRTLKPEWNSPQ